MRVWSIHPKHLDAKGLVALWRETLLAQHVLNGKTKGYTNHPQLNRFKALKNPVEGINQYLAEVFEEATRRGYKFDGTKIDWEFTPVVMKVTTGQMEYERQHLLKKLKERDEERFEAHKDALLDVHPMFEVVEGPIEDWEII